MLGIKVQKYLLHNNVLESTYSVATVLSDKNRQRTMDSLRKPLSFGRANKNRRDASVLIAICVNTNDMDDISILYTKRSATLNKHYSQVSFPGGKRDDEDSDAIDCALRECEEEIGLPRNLIDIWGAAGPIQHPSSGNITPVVGVVRDLNVQNLVINTNEVAEAFTVPLKELVKADNLHYTQFRNRYSIPVFTTQPHRVWGLTAYITFNFLSCLLPAEADWHQHKRRVKYIRPYKLNK